MLKGNYLQTLLQLDRSSPKFPDQLRGILDESGFHGYITNLEPDNLLKLVEYLDKVRPLHQT